MCFLFPFPEEAVLSSVRSAMYAVIATVVVVFVLSVAFVVRFRMRVSAEPPPQLSLLSYSDLFFTQPLHVIIQDKGELCPSPSTPSLIFRPSHSQVPWSQQARA